MADLPALSPDLPELRIIAQFAGIAPSRLAAAFNNPEHFLDHMTPDELDRFKDSCDRLNAIQVRMLAAVDIAITHSTRS